MIRVKKVRSGWHRGVKLTHNGVAGRVVVFLCEDCKHVTVEGNFSVLVPDGDGWKVRAKTCSRMR